MSHDQSSRERDHLDYMEREDESPADATAWVVVEVWDMAVAYHTGALPPEPIAAITSTTARVWATRAAAAAHVQALRAAGVSHHLDLCTITDVDAWRALGETW